MIAADRWRNGSFVTVVIVSRAAPLALWKLLQLGRGDRVAVLARTDHTVPHVIAGVRLETHVRFATSLKVIVWTESGIASVVFLKDLTHYRLGLIGQSHTTVGGVV
uniref:(northern house mosquito) hypothetical protein n=1 Tax=Culex pipiens TaxID=7175 RepID=A0A8D8H9T2_CULPI